MFSTISDIFSNNLIDQDNDSDKTIRKGLNTYHANGRYRIVSTIIISL